MPHTRQTEVYYYEELDERAKEKAREWFKQGYPESEWWDYIYDDTISIAKLLGIDIDEREQTYYVSGDSTPRKCKEVCIYFSGFYHQGSGSSFKGTWKAENVDVNNLKLHAPRDLELHKIADRLADCAKHNPELWAKIESPRDYYISVDVCQGEARDTYMDSIYNEKEAYELALAKDTALAGELIDALQDFNKWIYQQLKKEYEYLTSDEVVEETIIANEYEFTKEGKRV